MVDEFKWLSTKTDLHRFQIYYPCNTQHVWCLHHRKADQITITQLSKVDRYLQVAVCSAAVASAPRIISYIYSWSFASNIWTMVYQWHHCTDVHKKNKTCVQIQLFKTCIWNIEHCQLKVLPTRSTCLLNLNEVHQPIQQCASYKKVVFVFV